VRGARPMSAKSAIVLIIVLIAAAVGGAIGRDLAKGIWSWAMIKPIDREAFAIETEKRLDEHARKGLPMRVDDITVLWRVEYDQDNMMVVYVYRVDALKRDVLLDKVAASVTHKSCNSSLVNKKRDIAFRYVYWDKKDHYIGDIIVRDKDCPS
jgi:hypothetical protein